MAALLIALTACSSAASDAEDQYEIVAGSGDPKAACEAAQRVADAYLSAKDRDNYRKWLARRDEQCAVARLQGGSNG